MYVLDTSAVIDGRIVDMVANGTINQDIVIPNAVVAELEHQANTQREIGFAGIKVINQLKKFCAQQGIMLSFQGEFPKRSDIDHARSGQIDALIREIAKELDATLVTCDRVQYEIANIEDIKVMFLEPKPEEFSLPFLDFFDEYTQSVHLKEFCKPLAKKGVPGNIKLIEISNRELTPKEIRNLSSQIIELVKRDFDSFIELDSEGATVVQLREYRIVITKPPFSDGFEITIVKPLVKKTLKEYNLTEALLKRIDERAEGILVCGSPGMGKSTFAAALAEYYHSKGKIVKTLESPRDLQVSKEITQYSMNKEGYEQITDVILLVRPDYCIFDEVRKTRDFEIFTDLRLAGIGLIGVVHATYPIDAIQRFIGRVDLGIIPQIVDTIIYIHSGEVKTVYSLRFTVKIPSGMFESDLARPVIEVIDEATGTCHYEIYTFGEETVVIPLAKKPEAKKEKDIDALRKKINKYVRYNFHLEEDANGEIVLYLHQKDIPNIIGKKGKNITKLEKLLGKRIRVEEL